MALPDFDAVSNKYEGLERGPAQKCSQDADKAVTQRHDTETRMVSSGTA